MCAASWAFNAADPAAELVEQIRRETGVEYFDLALVLGSGWDDVAALAEQCLGCYPYRDWSCFPAGTIPGQSGRLLAVRYRSWHLLVFCGRFHCYQNLSAFQAAFPIRLASCLGASKVLLTCATGGINRAYQPGDFMLVDDHINLLGDNPLCGLDGEIFVDMVNTYQSHLYARVLKQTTAEIRLHRGVLAAMHGPSYETPAEIRLLNKMGADVVSMSTVPESIMARYLTMQVAAVALVANLGAGLAVGPVSHRDVLECGRGKTSSMFELVKTLLDTWHEYPIESCSSSI